MATLSKEDSKRMFGSEGIENLSILVFQRPHMRDSALEYELHMGRNILDGIFDKMRVMPEIVEATFSFPENWTNIVEQRALYPRLGKYCPNLKTVLIKTQSVYIVQCTLSKCVGIVQYEEPLSKESDEGKLWLPMRGRCLNSGSVYLVKGRL